MRPPGGAPRAVREPFLLGLTLAVAFFLAVFTWHGHKPPPPRTRKRSIVSAAVVGAASQLGNAPWMFRSAVFGVFFGSFFAIYGVVIGRYGRAKTRVQQPDA
jgi:hypothetical protein